MLHELGEQAPDTVAFTRNANQFHNCIFVELPNGEYDFSLIRHFLYDTALALRFDMLTTSSYEPLAALASKVRGELKYHTLHANTFIKQLGSATTESVSRLQTSLERCLPYALGMFEESPYEQELINGSIFAGERVLQEQWMLKVEEIVRQTQLRLTPWQNVRPMTGGRLGKHSEYLQPLLDEMSEVFRIDPLAEW
jgi:ring-1,2-phenylacetyl-CoA epoxidase subunit PaaC